MLRSLFKFIYLAEGPKPVVPYLHTRPLTTDLSQLREVFESVRCSCYLSVGGGAGHTSVSPKKKVPTPNSFNLCRVSNTLPVPPKRP